MDGVKVQTDSGSGFGSCVNNLVIALVVQNPQNSQEQIEDIKVKRNRSGNLLLDMIVTHNQLRINKDITTEDNRNQPAINQLHGSTSGEEHGHESKQDREPQGAEQVGHPVGKVVARLAGEERQGDEHAQREDERLHDDARVVEGDRHADGVGFEDGEAG